MIAIPVAYIIEAVVPCNIRNRMSEAFDHDTAHRKVSTVKPTVPMRKILCLPAMSAILPMGSRNTAEARIYPVTIQLRVRALPVNSRSINGNARFVELPIKGMKKDVIMTEMMMLFIRNVPLSAVSFVSVVIILPHISLSVFKNMVQSAHVYINE